MTSVASIEHEIERQYPYRQHLIFCLAMSLLFGCLVPICLWWALQPGREVVVHGLRFTGLTADVLRWCSVVVNMSMLILGLVMLCTRLAMPYQRIAFTRHGILMPRNRWAIGEEFVRFAEIDRTSDTCYRGHVTFFNLHSVRGTYSIARQKLTQAHFDEIKQSIQHRLERSPG